MTTVKRGGNLHKSATFSIEEEDFPKSRPKLGIFEFPSTIFRKYKTPRSRIFAVLKNSCFRIAFPNTLIDFGATITEIH